MLEIVNMRFSSLEKQGKLTVLMARMVTLHAIVVSWKNLRDVGASVPKT